MMEVLLLFTRESLTDVANTGRTGHWRINANRARGYEYVVLCQNNTGGVGGLFPHRTGFLVGKIKDVIPSDSLQYPGRFYVTIYEWAKIAKPELWPGNQCPIAYFPAIDIEFDQLEFQPCASVGKSSRSVGGTKLGIPKGAQDKIDQAQRFLDANDTELAIILAGEALDDVLKKLCEKYGVVPEGVPTTYSMLKNLRSPLGLSKLKFLQLQEHKKLRNSVAHGKKFGKISKERAQLMINDVRWLLTKLDSKDIT